MQLAGVVGAPLFSRRAVNRPLVPEDLEREPFMSRAREAHITTLVRACIATGRSALNRLCDLPCPRSIVLSPRLTRRPYTNLCVSTSVRDAETTL